MQNSRDDELREPNLLELYKQICARERCHANSAIVHQLMHECAGGTLPFASLNLQNNYLGPRGLRPVLQLIARCQTVQSIVLDGNGVDNDTVKELCTILRTHIGVFSLSLRNNPLSSPSATYLLYLLRDNVNITHVDVLHTDITDVMRHRIQVAVDKNGRRCAHRELLRLVPYKIDQLDSRMLHACPSSASASYPLPNILLFCPTNTTAVDQATAQNAGAETVSCDAQESDSAVVCTEVHAKSQQEEEMHVNHSCVVDRANHASPMDTVSACPPDNNSDGVVCAAVVAQADLLADARAASSYSPTVPCTDTTHRAIAAAEAQEGRQTSVADKRVDSPHVCSSPTATPVCRAMVQQRMQAIRRALAIICRMQDASPSGIGAGVADKDDAEEPTVTSALPSRHEECETTARTQVHLCSASADAQAPLNETTADDDGSAALPAMASDATSSSGGAAQGGGEKGGGGRDDKVSTCCAADTPKDLPDDGLAMMHTHTQTDSDCLSRSDTGMEQHAVHSDRCSPCQSQPVSRDTANAPEQTVATPASVSLGSPARGDDDDPLPPPSEPPLRAEERFRLLFDGGCQCYARGDFDEAYLLWSDALGIATTTRNPEWIAVTSSNIQQLSYDLLMSEGHAQRARGQLAEADESFALALRVAVQARNAAWESAIRQAQREVQRLTFQVRHDTARRWFDRARAAMLTSTKCSGDEDSQRAAHTTMRGADDEVDCGCGETGRSPDDFISRISIARGFFILPGTSDTRVPHTPAFVRAWPVLQYVREAVVMWTHAAYDVERTAAHAPSSDTAAHPAIPSSSSSSSSSSLSLLLHRGATQHPRCGPPAGTSHRSATTLPRHPITTTRWSGAAAAATADPHPQPPATRQHKFDTHKDDIYATVQTALNEVACFLLQRLFADAAESMTLSWMGTQHYHYHECTVLIHLCRDMMNCLQPTGNTTTPLPDNKNLHQGSQTESRRHGRDGTGDGGGGVGVCRANPEGVAAASGAAPVPSASSSPYSTLSPLLLAVLTSQLGNLYLATHQLTLAEEEFSEVMRIAAALPLSVMTAMTSTFAALLAEHRFNYGLAERYFTQAIPLWQRARHVWHVPHSPSSSARCGRTRDGVHDTRAGIESACMTPSVLAGHNTAPSDTRSNYCAAVAAVAYADEDDDETTAAQYVLGHSAGDEVYRDEAASLARRLREAVPLTYIDLMEHVCRMHRVMLFAKTFCYRQALEVLESALTTRHRDLLYDKISLNFTTSPTLEQLGATAEDAHSALVYYVLHRRFNWKCETNQYEVEESVMTWVVTRSREMRYVEVNVAADYQTSVTALLQSAREAMYVKSADCVSPYTAPVQTNRTPGVILTLPRATWMAPLRTLYRIFIQPIWHLLDCHPGSTTISTATTSIEARLQRRTQGDTIYAGNETHMKTGVECAECARRDVSAEARRMTVIPTGLLWQVPFSALIADDADEDEKERDDGVCARVPSRRDDEDAHDRRTHKRMGEDAAGPTAPPLSCRERGWHYLVERMTVQVALSALQWSFAAISAEHIRLRRGIQQINTSRHIPLGAELSLPSAPSPSESPESTEDARQDATGTPSAVPLANIAERNVVVVLPSYNCILGDACLRAMMDRTPFPFDPERSVREGEAMMQTWRAIREGVMRGAGEQLLWPSERLVEEMDAARRFLPQARTLHFACPVVSSEEQPPHTRPLTTQAEEKGGTRKAADVTFGASTPCAGVCMGSQPGHELALLETHELAQMQLFTEVAVLSGSALGAMCGVRATCDPVMSTIRALLCAGVPCVIAGLWCTPDMKPSELFSLFYQIHYARDRDPSTSACPPAGSCQIPTRASTSATTAARAATGGKCAHDRSRGLSSHARHTPVEKAVSLSQAIQALLRDDAVRYNPRMWAGYMLIGCGLL